MRKVFAFVLLNSLVAFCQYKSAISGTPSMPGNIQPSQTARIVFTLKNTGGIDPVTLLPAAWTNATVELRSTRNNWGVDKRPVSSMVLPGSSISFSIDVTAPSAPGDYEMGWKLFVKPYGTYFGTEVYKKVTVRYLPSQFIAKIYSEVLGRGPDGPGWNAYHSYFQQNGCNLATLTACLTNSFTRSDYNSLNYTNGEKVLTLYRAIQCRDPDQSGYNYWVTALDNGTSISNLVSSFTSSPEFAGLQNAIFNGGSYNSSVTVAVNFPFDRSDNSTIPLQPGQVLFSGSGSVALQDLLYRPGAGNTTVILKPRSVITISSPLTIPSGMTLSTYNDGTLTLTKYARFARLIRDPSSTSLDTWKNNGVVNLQAGAKLQYVFVDGAANWVSLVSSSFILIAPNILINPNSNAAGTSVSNCRSSDIQINTNLFLAEWNKFYPHIEVTNNLLTGYERSHYILPSNSYPWADGITNGGQLDCNIAWNYVIDPTDVGIILMNSDGSQNQHSQVVNNTIVSSGNGVYACLSVDGGTMAGATQTTTNFSGTLISNNNIMMGAGPNVHADLGICVNVRPWCFRVINTITGPLTISNNNLVGYPIANLNTGTWLRCNTALIISNVSNLTVSNNDLRPQIVATVTPNPNTLMHPICEVLSSTSNLSLNNNTMGMGSAVSVSDGNVFCIMSGHISH